MELSLKAALRYLAIEYPRDHDVSDVLLQAEKMRELPAWFKKEVRFMASASSDLARKRGAAMYGDEEGLTPASKLFDKKDAEKAMQAAGRVFKTCKKLIMLQNRPASKLPA